ncbi:hypothetical protein QFZ31_002276 [Neobacillus niacini]|uniref:Arm DNA-binding domain-containing protein n=1 Tax=Neobacillus driksii TaxID=3035913 RepID=UPI00278581D6|nr:Arm DNA-binding domain-containing protein [Neobacillus niacini]MDQ0972398.1 hypothetical protein [Neobacillus niacini]
MRGTIKKEGASWFVLYDAGNDPITGKRKQKKKRGFKTKKEAEKFLNEQLNSINNGTYFEPKDITLSEYLSYWVDNYAKLNLAPRTSEHYNYIITQHLIPTLGNIKISH